MRWAGQIAAFVAVLYLCAYATAESSPSTNSLAFHLQSLGRAPTAEEREIIEASLRLMERYEIRCDYPLKSVKRDAAKGEWVLDFDGSRPKSGVFATDSQFFLFLRDKNTSYVEVHWAGTNWPTRYPARGKKSAD